MNIWTFVTTTYIVLQIESIELTHTPDKSLFNVHLLRQRRPMIPLRLVQWWISQIVWNSVPYANVNTQMNIEFFLTDKRTPFHLSPFIVYRIISFINKEIPSIKASTSVAQQAPFDDLVS